ncbi:NACHT domain-containing protein [Kitasatospora paracochleata]|uniref:Transcriptional regulator with XRE-family HTH domain n=1 Tax=Kitasatospora paracochleata TaxID=58354 RepID=A0ABT1IU55_9ACTN|nr:helix-turn-helix transcriptional regulator [Kitasatospora paracochleata]MCP2308670.1 transcriptional regulator with XRE-family HTH domain [Kitasatospora paracochleata]
MTDQLGTLLRGLRNRAGLTQEQVAERSGVSVRTIRRLETGRSTDHRMGTVNLLADALEIGPDDRKQLSDVLAGTETAEVGRTDAGAGVPAEPSAPPPAAAPRAPAAPPVHPALADAALELATEVRRRWRDEEAQRRIAHPFPLPVRWRPAPAELTDRAENVQRLGPGGVPRQLDLSGDLRSVAEVYRRVSSGRLVVLGRAGSGKSVLTIRLVLDLLEAPAAVGGRVPVVCGLGPWDPKTVALRDWLIARLLRDHPHLARRGPGRGSLAAALVDADLILPVLDGFDEIAEGLRREALEALNASTMPLVLTSRREEFAEAVRAAHAPPAWAAGIELTDLTLDDLGSYLPRTDRTTAPDGEPGGGSVWDGVLDALRDPRTPGGANLAAALTTPLMVSLARTMYSDAPDRDPAELLDTARFPTVRALEEHLLAGFLPAVYRPAVPEPDAPGPRRRKWDPERAEYWLGHLAQHLVRLDRDQQDLGWWQLGDTVRRSTRVLAVVVATALAVALPNWLVYPLVTAGGIGEALLQGSLMGPVAGVAFGSVYAAMLAVGSGRALEPTRVRLRLPGRRGGGRRSVRTFGRRFVDGLLGGSVMGVGCACALTLERALYPGIPITDPAVIEATLINMLCFGLIFGLAAGLVFGLVAALEAPVDVASAATPADLLATNRRAVVRQVLVLAPAFTLVIAFGGRLVVDALQGWLGPLNWRLSDALVIGTVAGLGGGLAYALAFTAWGQWLVLSRVWLPLTGRLPWDPEAFLDDAYRRGVLRRTGAVYQFRHLRLQHHLAHTFRRRRAGYAPARFPSTDARTGAPTADPSGTS